MSDTNITLEERLRDGAATIEKTGIHKQLQVAIAASFVEAADALAALREENDELHDKVEQFELDEGIWPEWAEKLLKMARKHNGNDSSDDADGVCLLGEMEQAFDMLKEGLAIADRQDAALKARIADLESQLAALQRASSAPIAEQVERSEIGRLREAQAAAVMPLIGALLDEWEGLPGDDKEAIEDEFGDLAQHIEAIGNMMLNHPDPKASAESGGG